MKLKFLSLILPIIFTTASCNNETNKPKIFYNKADSAILSYKIVDLDSGWGYSIYKNENEFIYQDKIPVVCGNFLFSSPEKAEKTAKYIIKILSQKTGFPTISYEELDSLNVLDDTVKNFQKNP